MVMQSNYLEYIYMDMARVVTSYRSIIMLSSRATQSNPDLSDKYAPTVEVKQCSNS